MNFEVIEVKNGKLVSDPEWQATTCAGEQLADGFYVLGVDDPDPIHKDPYPTAQAAEEAGKAWEKELAEDPDVKTLVDVVSKIMNKKDVPGCIGEKAS